MSRREPKPTLLSLGTKNEARYSGLIKEIAMPEGTVSAVPTKILVPIDFSSSSHTALEVATELADKFHAELVLLNVVPESPVVALPEGVSEESIVEAAKNQAEGHLSKSKAS